MWGEGQNFASFASQWEGSGRESLTRFTPLRLKPTGSADSQSESPNTRRHFWKDIALATSKCTDVSQNVIIQSLRAFRHARLRNTPVGLDGVWRFGDLWPWIWDLGCTILHILDLEIWSFGFPVS